MSPDACERNTARAPARARGLPGSQKKHGFIARVQSTSNNNEPRLAVCWPEDGSRLVFCRLVSELPR